MMQNVTIFLYFGKVVGYLEHFHDFHSLIHFRETKVIRNMIGKQDLGGQAEREDYFVWRRKD